MASFVSLDGKGGFDVDVTAFEIFEHEFIDACVEGLNRSVMVLRKSVEANLSGHGELSRHVKRYKAKRTNNAIIAGVTFKGNVKSGWQKEKEMAASTAAFWLEYGTVKQPARPWMDKSVNMVEGEVLRNIQQAHDELVERLGIAK